MSQFNLEKCINSDSVKPKNLWLLISKQHTGQYKNRRYETFFAWESKEQLEKYYKKEIEKGLWNVIPIKIEE